MGCDALIPGLGDFEYVLTVVGLLYVVKLAIQTLWAIVNGIRDHWWSRLWKKHLVEDYGKWAGQEYGVETEIVQLDFMTGRPIYEDIAKHLEDKEIGVLVNNVGVMLSHPMEFELSSDKDIWNHINVNMASVPAMTKLILPGMLSRGKGAIINVASIAGLHPIPLMGIYSASKAFVDYFSQALDWEYRGSGITVQTVTPSYVSTNMTKFSELVHRPSVLIPTAQTFVSNALHTLGYARRTSGYWAHGIQVHMVETFVNKWMFMYGNYMWNSYLLWNMKKNQARSR
ncbi:inactive hydroxysteroid dehydrogenase-like protein 1 isoform X2 [Homarus americanus]|uniref:inactive hydroxysteroid dehydrogenase-like protein 1 isoform X2 n=1 Tax=Homarus americanus TaxID=6706 RepID=UPI001C436A4F|nr:inactive hydroxysteroid dehydrogenase-like protein 1 isoform X2 [Homarus americanus]